MSKKRKFEEMSQNFDDLRRRNKELENEKSTLMDRILQLEASNNVLSEKNESLEQENRKLLENCNCPKVKLFTILFYYCTRGAYFRRLL